MKYIYVYMVNSYLFIIFIYMKLINLLLEGKEFIIWGVPPGKTDEDILYTKATSMEEAKKVMEILSQKHGVTKMRVQVLDISQPTDFGKDFGKTINKK